MTWAVYYVVKERGDVMKSRGGYLAHVVIDRATRHVLHDNAKVWLACAGADELDHILVAHLPHDGHFLHTSKETYSNANNCKIHPLCLDRMFYRAESVLELEKWALKMG